MESIIAIFAISFTMGIPIVAIWTHHQRKMLEMKMRAGSQQGYVVTEIEDLKKQVAELRDTTTRYDLSFDAALQRIESRVGHVENRVTAIEQTESVSARP